MQLNLFIHFISYYKINLPLTGSITFTFPYIALYTCSHLGRDDLYGRHEAVRYYGHSQEHVHERGEVDHRSGHLFAKLGLVGLPDGEKDAGQAHRVFDALILFARPGAVAVGRRRQELGGEHGGRGPQTHGVAARLAAGVAALGLRLAGRQWVEEEEDEEEEAGGGGGQERHVRLCVVPTRSGMEKGR